jgi:hypothetical protein
MLADEELILPLAVLFRKPAQLRPADERCHRRVSQYRAPLSSIKCARNSERQSICLIGVTRVVLNYFNRIVRPGNDSKAIEAARTVRWAGKSNLYCEYSFKQRFTAQQLNALRGIQSRNRLKCSLCGFVSKD